MTATPTAALILAAGEGKRMRSSLPKVLHPCVEVPLVTYVVKLALACQCNPIVVVISAEGRRVRDLVTAQFPEAPLRFAVQDPPAGTGDAARVGLAQVGNEVREVLILCGDAPLLRPETVARLREARRRGAEVAFLTAIFDDEPSGYGRVVREGGRVRAIVEEKDATAAERAIREVNAGAYLADTRLLRGAVRGLRASNAQSEFYLTDVVAQAAQRSGGAEAVVVDDPHEIRGVNSQAELAAVERVIRLRLIAAHQAAGVRFLDPEGTFLGAGVRFGRDVTVGVGVQLWGHTEIGDRVRIDGPTVIRDCQIAADATIHALSHLEGAVVGAAASVGPFARLRPQARLEADARVGNFVEMKKATLGKGSKAGHLAYLGDADIGSGCNIGAGTITCNYDGQGKYPTVLADGVFIGSNATLVAPVTVGANAYVAAGSTVTKDVPADAVAFGRARQANRDGYATLLRQRQAAAKAAAKSAASPPPSPSPPASASLASSSQAGSQDAEVAAESKLR